MATIGDVAKRVGVSRTAVSFAFNKPEQLAEETLQRILDVAHELGYYPNPAARALNSGRTGIVGVLTPQRSEIIFSNPFMPDFFKGVGRVGDCHGLSLLLVSPIQGSLTRAMNNVKVDGFITLGLSNQHHEVDLLCRRKVPFVVVDAQAPRGVSSIQIDEEGGAAAAAAHLLDAGHRDILTIAVRAPQGDRYSGGPPHPSDEEDERYDVLQRRLRGYADAFNAHGLPFPRTPDRLVYAESTLEDGARALREALCAGAPPTAVLAMSDALAMGVMHAARDAGLRIPQDLSVVGFDDVPGAALTAPALTTVHQPGEEKGARAAELLVAVLNGQTEPVRDVLPTWLVARGSVAGRRAKVDAGESRPG